LFHVEQLRQRLLAGGSALGLAIEPVAAEKMLVQLELLERWNGKLNLVGPGTAEDWLARHTLDSLVPSEMILQGATVLDVGSGAGFPGVPLALLLPDSQFSLLERRTKRRAFLQNVLASAGVGNAVVLAELAPEQRFDVVLGRAVLPPQAWLQLGATLIHAQGRVGLFAQSEIAEMDPRHLAQAAGLELVGHRDYTVPGQPERAFFWFEKSRST
jgi:16S rRNA (guanine527-N7)-methyltransferase